jgi:hypothetical protein
VGTQTHGMRTASEMSPRPPPHPLPTVTATPSTQPSSSAPPFLLPFGHHPSPLSTPARPLPLLAPFPHFEVTIVGSGPPDAGSVTPVGAHHRSFARRRHVSHSEILPFVHHCQPTDPSPWWPLNSTDMW